MAGAPKDRHDRPNSKGSPLTNPPAEGPLVLTTANPSKSTPRILKVAAAAGIAVEHNANPNRLDLSDLPLRMANEASCKIVVNTDAHHTTEFENLRYGIGQLRRAWLTKEDTVNTLPARAFSDRLPK